MLHREPLTPPTIAERAFNPLAPLQQVLDLMASAHTTLRSHLNCRRVKIPVQGDAEVAQQIDRFFVSAQLGFLPHIRVDRLPTLTGLHHSLTLTRLPDIEDGLDFSDASYDEMLYLSAAVATTAMRNLLQLGSSHLTDFPRPNGAAYLHNDETTAVSWSGIPDIPELWRSLTQLDALVPIAISQPERVSFPQLLRATHFCAAASQLT